MLSAVIGGIVGFILCGVIMFAVMPSMMIVAGWVGTAGVPPLQTAAAIITAITTMAMSTIAAVLTALLFNLLFHPLLQALLLLLQIFFCEVVLGVHGVNVFVASDTAGKPQRLW